MQLISVNQLSIYQFDIFSNIEGLGHFISTRQIGNVGYNTTDSIEIIDQNRIKIANAFGLEKLIFPVQTHKNHSIIVNKENQKERFENTDALITQEKNMCIAVICADCVPILLYDKKNKVIATVHAGWRGTVAKIVQTTIENMVENFGTTPQDILAGIGPSISEKNYEVGKEVIDEVEKAFGKEAGLITNQQNEKGHLNLWEANKQLLVKSGVLEKNIEIAEICTKENADTFFSVRHQTQTGRFATGIFLK